MSEWSFEGYWATVIGAHLSADTVVRLYALKTPEDACAWLTQAQGEAMRAGGKDASLQGWDSHFPRALEMLEQAIQQKPSITRERKSLIAALATALEEEIIVLYAVHGEHTRFVRLQELTTIADAWKLAHETDDYQSYLRIPTCFAQVTFVVVGRPDAAILPPLSLKLDGRIGAIIIDPPLEKLYQDSPIWQKQLAYWKEKEVLLEVDQCDYCWEVMR